MLSDWEEIYDNMNYMAGVFSLSIIENQTRLMLETIELQQEKSDLRN